jgi:hypothetical protein
MKSWVSRVEASRFDPAAAYVSLDAHRDDDFSIYLYRTDDYGDTWVSIASNLPPGVPANVVRGDVRNPNLLFVGTESSVFASIDLGASWHRLGAGLPTVPVDDLIVHPRDPELVAGTHGRSIYVLDIGALQQLTPQVISSPVHLFVPRPVILFNVDWTRNKGASGARRFAADNPFSELVPEGDSSGLTPPGSAIHYFLSAAHEGGVTLDILDAEGRVIRELTGPGRRGINRVLWDARRRPESVQTPWRRVGGNDARRLANVTERPGPLVPPGEYRARLRAGSHEATQVIQVERDR